MATVAEQLAGWGQALTPADVPAPVRRAATRHLLDGLGCALAALRGGNASPALTVARSLGGPPEARLPGSHDRIGAVAAALGTGALVHALDFDDTHAGGLVHATTVVLPVVLAVGQQVGATGEQALLAAVVGYEAICRLGAGSPHGFHARGLHATGVCGPLAAAAVAARLLGLSAQTTTHALGIAGSSAAGLLEFLETGASTKQLHPGSAAAAGILAARLAAAGGTGPASVVEGRYGLYAGLSARPADPASVVADLGSRWETTCITIKPYPACQLLHATLDAVATLGLRAPDVLDVRAQVHPDALDVVCEPRSAKTAPRTPYDAKFSLPWSVAALLVDGEVGVDTYSAASLARPEVAALAARVHVEVVPSPGAAADAPGRVAVRTADGRELVGEVAASSGGPRSPLTDDALAAKFSHNVGDHDLAAALQPLVLDLAALPTLEPLLDLVAGAAS
ncbi:MAG TPA: MmgE/PrpD family protein [Mycobacteriales bacterium]|nr:MmgE/PrpD family protein [Mycobacteriales bacterium]